MDKKTLANSTEGFPLIGWCVHWAGSGFSFPFSEFLEILDEVGIPRSIARETLPKNAFLRAVREAAKGKTTFARKVIDGEAAAVSVIARESIDKADLEYDVSQESTITFDKATKQISVKGDSEDEISEKFEQFKTDYTASQFRSVVLRYVKRECDGIMVKEGGGLYFVPAFKEGDFSKLQALFDSMAKNFSVELGIIPIVDTKMARQSMWQSMIGKTKEDLSKLEEDLNDLDDVTSKSFDLRIKKYQDLKTKVELYETLLEGTAQELKEGLEHLTAKLKAKMTE